MKRNQSIAILRIALVTVLTIGAGSASATRFVEESYWINDPEQKYLPTLLAQPELTIDHPNSLGYEIYGPEGLSQWLKLQNIPSRANSMGPPDDKILADYPTPEEIESQLKKLHAEHPTLTKLFSIGKSHQGRELWVMKISDNPEMDELEPEFKYISSMHGDEITGRGLMMRFIEEALKKYKKYPKWTELIDNTEIYIMPSMNPDGSAAQRRGNGRGVDLNRDFPDFTTSDNQNKPDGREPETQAVMKFQDSRNFALSANFHGGAEVVNYPWDTQKRRHQFNDLVRGLSLEYAARVEYMAKSRRFPGGVTNGYDWYTLDGGMQDWSSHWYGDLQVTIELSNEKWPAYSKIDSYYEDNKKALLDYALSTHQGAGFGWKSASPDRSGEVEIIRQIKDKKVSLGKFAFRRSEFFKTLDSGSYLFKIEVLLPSKQELEFEVEVERKIQENGNYHLF